jgi:hypothetical protein
MNSKVSAVLFFVAAVLSSCARQPSVRVVTAAEGPALIEGTVIYEDGSPTKGATVSAFPLDRGLAAKVPSADTDELGHFQIVCDMVEERLIGNLLQSNCFEGVDGILFVGRRYSEAKRCSAESYALTRKTTHALLSASEDESRNSLYKLQNSDFISE